MKKISRMPALVLAVILLVCSLPTAVWATEAIPESVSYHNTIAVTVESTAQRSFSPADFPALAHCDRVFITGRKAVEGGYAYQLLLHLSQSGYQAVADGVAVMKEQPGVVAAALYTDAWDYPDLGSYARLDHAYMRLLPGQEVALSVAELHTISGQSYLPYGVDVTVDPARVDPSVFLELGASRYYGNTQQIEKISLPQGGVYYTPHIFATENKVSPINNYCVVAGEKDYYELADALAGMEGVLDFAIWMDSAAYTTDVPGRQWSVEGDSVRLVETQDENSITVEAVKEGDATVTFSFGPGGGYPKVEASCYIHVCRCTSAVGHGYDGTLLVTVTTNQQDFDPTAYFNDKPVAEITFTEKRSAHTGTMYEMLWNLILPEEPMAANQAVERIMEELEADPLVTKVARNRYAGDYGEKASCIQLNQQEVLIPVGGQTQLYIVDKNLVSDPDSNAIGIQFEIDPDTFTAPVEEGAFRALGIQTFWALPEDLQTDERGYLLYEYYSPYEWFDPSLKNAVSSSNTYFGILDGEDQPREDFARAFHGAVHHLATTPGIQSARVAHTYPAPTGTPPHEDWRSSNDDVVSISLIDGVPADVYIDRLHTGHRVTLSGNSVGTASVKVTTGGGNVSRSTACSVTVYQPGDTTMDERVDAADALDALQYSVGKADWNNTGREFVAGEVTGDGIINAVDALHILQYAVGKRERFSTVPGGDWVKIDPVQFPDESFRRYLSVCCDGDGDGYLSQEEVSAVKELNLQGGSVLQQPGVTSDPVWYSDLTGIGCFTALETLHCAGNPLQELDLAHNPNLKTLVCTDTDIEHLDLRYNKQLTTLKKDPEVSVYGWVNQP